MKEKNLLIVVVITFLVLFIVVIPLAQIILLIVGESSAIIEPGYEKEIDRNFQTAEEEQALIIAEETNLEELLHVTSTFDTSFSPEFVTLNNHVLGGIEFWANNNKEEKKISLFYQATVTFGNYKANKTNNNYFLQNGDKSFPVSISGDYYVNNSNIFKKSLISLENIQNISFAVLKKSEG